MKFHVLTLFPEMIMQGLNTSILGKAAEKNLIEINAVNIRDYTLDKHGKVDDYPYGGGAGMLMQAQPVYDAHKSVCGEKKVRTIYVSPKGEVFTQKKALELADEEELVFLCGHYEGIDERVLEEIVTDTISIGDYVLTGGELPTMVMIDAISRLIPGVLHNDISAETETFHKDLLEYPQYSRPEVWHGKKVPEVLLCGDHKKITEWRVEQSIELTKNLRPDLYEKYEYREKIIAKLSKKKRQNIPMIESLRRGNGEVLYYKNGSALIYEGLSKTCMIHAEEAENAADLVQRIPDKAELVLFDDANIKELLEQSGGYEEFLHCKQFLYTKKEQLPVKFKDIRLLDESNLPYLQQNYTDEGLDYLKNRIENHALYGAFFEGKQIGFAGTHIEGGVGFLFVEEAYRGKGIAKSLEAYVINKQKEYGFTSYCHVETDNVPSLSLQEKLGLYASDKEVWWFWKRK